MLAVAAPRENASATDLYLFPIGVVAGMATIVARALAEDLTGALDDGQLVDGAVAIAVLLFPAMGGLAARGRNGLARLLLIVALCLAYIYSYTPLTIALFAGYLALSFAISDLSRTARELSWGAAALILLSPLIPALAPTISAWIFHARLGSLPAPYRSLSVAADVFTHDKLRLITGHGFATVSHGVRDGILPADTPRALAFTVWYELGIVGAILAAAGAWLAFRNLPRAPARLAPYMAASFSAVVALAFLNVDFAEMTTLTLIGVAIISTDVAARSQYRTSRPSAARTRQSLRSPPRFVTPSAPQRFLANDIGPWPMRGRLYSTTTARVRPVTRLARPRVLAACLAASTLTSSTGTPMREAAISAR